MAGFGLSDDQIHVPSEKLSIFRYIQGIADESANMRAVNNKNQGLSNPNTTIYCVSNPLVLGVIYQKKSVRKDFSRLGFCVKL